MQLLYIRASNLPGTLSCGRPTKACAGHTGPRHLRSWPLLPCPQAHDGSKGACRRLTTVTTRKNAFIHVLLCNSKKVKTQAAEYLTPPTSITLGSACHCLRHETAVNIFMLMALTAPRARNRLAGSTLQSQPCEHATNTVSGAETACPAVPKEQFWKAKRQERQTNDALACAGCIFASRPGCRHPPTIGHPP